MSDLTVDLECAMTHNQRQEEQLNMYENRCSESRFVVQSDESRERLSSLGISEDDQAEAFERLNAGLERISATQRAEQLGAEALFAQHLGA